MLLRVVIDYLDAVAAGVSDRDAARLGSNAAWSQSLFSPFGIRKCLEWYGGLQAIEARYAVLRVARRDFRKKRAESRRSRPREFRSPGVHP